MAHDYDDITTVNELLKEAQNSEYDLREQARNSHHFIDKIDGQWEPEIVNRHRTQGRPLYTFDKTGPIIDQIAGEIANGDFALRVRPSGGEASKETAQIYDGLIRNIRNISDADHISNETARGMITAGMDGFEIVHDFVNENSFEQELVFRKIHDYLNNVWFESSAKEQDNSDANFVFILTSITREEFEKEFPNATASPIDVGSNRRVNVYFNKPSNMIQIGRILYKVETKRDIVLMSNGKVYDDDEKFEKVKDELAADGIVEINRRERMQTRVHSRLFSGAEFLTEAEETEFSMLPIVSFYGNFKITEGKRITRGVVEKLKDPQRVYNYALSRDIEEGALAPRAKYWMTREQQQGHTRTLATMNVNKDPVQTYNHVNGQPAPFFQGGAQPNPGLQTTANNMSEVINSSAGLFAANMGDNPGLQSGIAIDRQISKGDNGTVKFVEAVQYGWCYAGKVCVDTIPRIYDTRRQIRVLNEDGSFEMQMLHDLVMDRQSGQFVELNDLSRGTYDVTCEVGQSFKSQQREAAAAFAEIAQVDPTILEIAKDVWFKNLDTPGMDVVSERARAMMIEQGRIPFDQMTEEEQAVVRQQQSQQPQEDPNMVLAKAEQGKAQADLLSAQTKAQQMEMDGQIKMGQIQLQNKKLDLDRDKFIVSNQDKNNVEAAKITQGQQEIALKERQLSLDEQAAAIEQALAMQQQNQQQINDAIANLKTLREAIGADTIVGPSNQAAYIKQSLIVNDMQNS